MRAAAGIYVVAGILYAALAMALEYRDLKGREQAAEKAGIGMIPPEMHAPIHAAVAVLMFFVYAVTWPWRLAKTLAG